jgi:hypothetical protein
MKIDDFLDRVMFHSWPNNLGGPLVVVEKSAQSSVDS